MDKNITYWENIHNQVARLEIINIGLKRKIKIDIFEVKLYIYDNLNWNCVLQIILPKYTKQEIDLDIKNDLRETLKYVLECMNKMHWYKIDIVQVENKGFSYVLVQ